jgi:acylphosphatase
MKRILVRYEGRVQGVGFRASTRQISKKFAVKGWVKNLPDGSVSMVAEAEEMELERFLEAIRRSHLGPHIRREIVEPASQESLGAAFEIRI